ncbi:RNA polymerase sigma factor [Pseudomonas multiresinivorans]|uniref:Sigma-70 family RNA polymerase sigma factor n=1 Tax=Pseudomonas multiresinivorans TaxID=95301 RepID=A0A7Z3BHJ1_9PSED|nr:sigma-70 family RNA polymerase sigma factor [Pseudomonas multiresinivorans]QJP07016.1 sigma-70 family RNA polymerase sigma factor [Pseudomonas multiresinivorans]
MSHSERPADSRAADAPAPAEALPREDFLRVFLSQRPRMEALVRRRVGCRATAADLVQDLFLRFWKRPQAPVEELGSYLLRSARNLAIDHLRGEDSRGRTLSALLPDDDDAQPSPEQAVQAGAELDLIEDALRKLPERTRHIFLLSRVHGRTYGEIAAAMGLSQSGVEKHMMRALDACKASLEPASPAHRRGAADR